MAETVLTIGHSTRSLDEFIGILKTHGIQLVADVRTVPRSRHNPQFNSEELAKALGKNDIAYIHMKGLGGLRRPLKDSPNKGWKNASFRGFADYMQTKDFEEALNNLIATAKKQRTSIMCAEAVPWRCHRSLISDALTVRGFEVQHLIRRTSVQPQKLTAWAKAEGTHITYPESEAT